MEILLAYLEFRQYEMYVINALNLVINDNIIREFENIPISSIITTYDTNTEYDNITKIKHIGYDLYFKYIEHGSEYEINISHDTRHALIDLMDDKETYLNMNINSNDLLKIFDDCCWEMKRLLQHSLMRAKQKTEFINQLKQCFNISKNT